MKKGLVLLILAALAACTNNYKPEIETVEIKTPGPVLYLIEDNC
jgi:hypothetical protein